jgi:WD40 repeat protein
VTSVAFSPDGRTVITGSADNTARLWDAATGQPRSDALPHFEPIRAVTFSPDGKFALTCSDDNMAALWDTTTGEPIGEPLRHNVAIVAVAVSPDSQTIVTGSIDNTAQLWDAVTGQRRGEPLRHTDRVTAVAFGPNGQTVITGSYDHTARLWNVPPPAQDEQERLQLSVEVRTGYHTDANGIRRTLNQAIWLDRKQKLQALGGPCGVRNWDDLTPEELRQSVPTLVP